MLTGALLGSGAGRVMADEALARKYGCFDCHGTDKRGFVGPTFKEISERYKDKPDAVRVLIPVVKNGGKGNWTEISRGVPMPPYKHRIREAEIERLVRWLLGR
jgi:cytochrome c